jgi:hypothetical protein
LPDRSLLDHNIVQFGDGGFESLYALAESKFYTAFVTCERKASTHEVNRAVVNAFPNLDLAVRGFA